MDGEIEVDDPGYNTDEYDDDSGSNADEEEYSVDENYEGAAVGDASWDTDDGDNDEWNQRSDQSFWYSDTGD